MLCPAIVLALAFVQSHPIPNSDYWEYEGTVSVVELDGKEATDRDGRIVFGVWPRVSDFSDPSTIVKGAGILVATSDVVDGRFHFKSILDSMFIVLRLEFGGYVAHVRGNHPFAPTPTSPWRIEADRNLVRSVSVVGAEDGAPLEHVVVAAAEGPWNREPPSFDRTSIFLLQDATSPFEFAALDADPSREKETSYWIRARRREWRRWNARFEKDARNVVRLEAAATLVVELDREIPGDEVCVELYDAKQLEGAGERWIDRIFTKDEQVIDRRRCSGSKRVEFDPVPPGDYAAVAIVQDFTEPYRRATGYGIARVTVPAKTAAKASIAVTGPVTPAGFEFSGTLRFDPAWQEELPTLHLWTRQGYDDENGQPRTHIVRAADYHPIEGAPNSYRWTFGPVLPGWWTLRVDGWSQFDSLEVGRDGAVHRDLRIGPPVETLVQIVDDRTGEPAQIEDLHFGVGEKSGFWPRAATRASARPGEFRLRSPTGPIQLIIRQRDYWGFRESLEIVEDMPTVVLRARRIGGVHLFLTVDGKPRLPDDFSARLVGVGDTKGGAPKPSFTSAEGEVFLVVEEAGRYRLEVTSGIGLAAIPSREFDLAPGIFEELKLELAPAK